MKKPNIFSLGCRAKFDYPCDMWSAVIYLWLINGLTLLIFGWDKLRAAQRKRRISERKLLWLALLGGSPGAILGRWLFRHKTHKGRFTLYLFAILGIQAALIYWLVTKVLPGIL